MPVKDPHTRIKLLTLASGHGRCMAVTPERILASVGEWPLHGLYKYLTASLPKRLRNGRSTSEIAVQYGGFRSETATWIQVVQKTRWNFYKAP
jgi:hypothetical protein